MDFYYITVYKLVTPRSALMDDTTHIDPTLTAVSSSAAVTHH